MRVCYSELQNWIALIEEREDSDLQASRSDRDRLTYYSAIICTELP